ncbi:MAG TPA: 5-deoxy-glucuronate isomerase [Jatrophihabitans sp.]|jgi:5-deoxy-glucuronate isomerase
MTMSLHIPASHGAADVVVTPEQAGWDWCGLSILQLSAGIARTVRTADSEVFVLPLSGGCAVSVADEGDQLEASFELGGRASVFTGVTDFCYAGRDSVLTLTSPRDTTIALPSARCSQRRPAAYGAAEDVPVEVRGAGPATRQVVNFGVPGVWDHAERLISCELLTPPGNWSSYPPHKHDASAGCEIVNEEIYYYRIAGQDQITPSRNGFGLHRTYTGPEHDQAGLPALDEFIEVRDGDVVLIPYGYHGPCVAAPGYPMYYLNVLAGPAEERSMAFCDDPAHSWIRDSWTGMPTDPRCSPQLSTGSSTTAAKNAGLIRDDGSSS